jgi:hypothetical protein
MLEFIGETIADFIVDALFERITYWLFEGFVYVLSILVGAGDYKRMARLSVAPDLPAWLGVDLAKGGR